MMGLRRFLTQPQHALDLTTKSRLNFEIERFYKKESNKNKLADDLLDQKIIEMLKEHSKIKEKDQKTSELEGASNQ